MKWKKQRERIAEMKREIERRGGVLHIDDRLPLALTEKFLQEILDCPQCQAEAKKEH